MSAIPSATQQVIQPPERIYGWLDSQLSIARHYGSCRFNGALYVVDPEDPDAPLVRIDVLDAEKKKRLQDARDRRQADALKAAMAQGTLL